jgi:hypothetical protein
MSIILSIINIYTARLTDHPVEYQAILPEDSVRPGQAEDPVADAFMSTAASPTRQEHPPHEDGLGAAFEGPINNGMFKIFLLPAMLLI